jgi:hypothetical protein
MGAVSQRRRFSFSPWFDRIASKIPAAPLPVPMHMMTTCWRSLQLDQAFRFALIIEQLGDFNAVGFFDGSGLISPNEHHGQSNVSSNIY